MSYELGVMSYELGVRVIQIINDPVLVKILFVSIDGTTILQYLQYLFWDIF